MSESLTKQQFVDLLTEHQSQLFGFIYALVHNWDDAEDLYQQTALVLWKKMAEFEPNTAFFHWACKTARYEVLNHMRRKSRDKVQLSQAFVDGVCEAADRQKSEAEIERQQALIECVSQLSAPDRKLLEDCYTGPEPIHEVASRAGRSANAVYNALARIRRAVQECVRRRLSQEDTP